MRVCLSVLRVCQVSQCLTLYAVVRRRKTSGQSDELDFTPLQTDFIPGSEPKSEIDSRQQSLYYKASGTSASSYTPQWKACGITSFPVKMKKSVRVLRRTRRERRHVTPRPFPHLQHGLICLRESPISPGSRPSHFSLKKTQRVPDGRLENRSWFWWENCRQNSAAE